MMNWRWHLNSTLVKLAVWLLRSTGWYGGYWNHWRTMFAYAEGKGLHILPVHYYSPIPDTRTLPNDLWQRPRMPHGFDLRIEAARHWLAELDRKFGSEYNKFPQRSEEPQKYYLQNSAYRSGDAEVLYAILRDLKPRRIVEIGSGFSTLLVCEAIRANRRDDPGYQCEFVAIEPYPPTYLSPKPAELTRIEPKPLQKIGQELFSSLGAGDILFIDSSHVVCTGSDVVHEYLDILPRLAPDVVIHIHDIFIPAEYPRRFLDEARFFWNEQYLVEAFLTHNREFEVIMPVCAVLLSDEAQFRKYVPSFQPGQHVPSSFWLRRRNPDM